MLLVNMFVKTFVGALTTTVLSFDHTIQLFTWLIIIFPLVISLKLYSIIFFLMKTFFLILPCLILTELNFI